MTDPNYTAISLLVDRSGSMTAIRSDAEGGINAFLAEQEQGQGRRTVRITTFDTQLELHCPSTPVADVPRFELHPRGATALLDAMAREIDAFGAELAGMPQSQRPGHVLFAVMTDGEENSSVEFTWTQVAERVRHQEETYGWTVLYLGANQDAIATAAKLGVSAGQSMTYRASGAGTRNALRTLSDVGIAVAAGASPVISDAQRREAMQDD